MEPESPGSMERDHSADAISRRLAAGPAHSYLRDVIYGAIDGTVTTFAVVAGVAGAGLRSGVVIILGMANLIADGFSMGVSNYLASRAERQQRERARRQEEHEIRTVPEGEREEIRQIYAAKGFEGEDLDRIVEVITSDRELWLDTMMTEELGYATELPNELRAGASTFVAFLVVGFVPLITFVTDLVLPVEIANPFLWSSVLTGIAFAVVGGLKSRFVDQPVWRAALETVAVGGAAAVLAYGAGAFLGGIVD